MVPEESKLFGTFIIPYASVREAGTCSYDEPDLLSHR
jgi:hypothetical protein